MSQNLHMLRKYRIALSFTDYFLLNKAETNDIVFMLHIFNFFKIIFVSFTINLQNNYYNIKEKPQKILLKTNM